MLFVRLLWFQFGGIDAVADVADDDGAPGTAGPLFPLPLPLPVIDVATPFPTVAVPLATLSSLSAFVSVAGVAVSLPFVAGRYSSLISSSFSCCSIVICSCSSNELCLIKLCCLFIRALVKVNKLRQKIQTLTNRKGEGEEEEEI